MPNSENKTNKNKSIRIRYSLKELEEIKKFVKNSKFSGISGYFRYLDESFRSGDLIQKNNYNHDLNNDSLKEINELKRLYNENEKESKKVHDKLDSIYKLIHDKNKNRVSSELKGQLLTLLEKAKYTRQEISKILNIDEDLVADGLAELINKELVEYNNKAEYLLKKAHEN